MATKLLNHYKGMYDGSAVSFCDAETMEEAVKVFSESTEPVLVQRTGSGVKVVVPDADLAFKTTVEDTAYTAGCRAYPSGGSVTRGQVLFLTAVAAEGYTFAGWYNGEELISSDAEAEVTVASSATVPATLVYEAKFETA